MPWHHRGRQQEEVMGELYKLRLLQQYSDVLSWCIVHRMRSLPETEPAPSQRSSTANPQRAAQ
eukprot:650402-Pyramimonas_sp.AAC.2